MLKSSIRETYTYRVPASSTPLVVNPIESSGTNTIGWSGCAVSCVLQQLNGSKNWVDFASTTEITFVSSGTNVCRLTVDFTETSTFWTTTLNRAKTTYTFRIGVQYSNVLATSPGAYAVYDDFDLVMEHYCSSDKLQITSPKLDIAQTIYSTD